MASQRSWSLAARRRRYAPSQRAYPSDRTARPCGCFRPALRASRLSSCAYRARPEGGYAAALTLTLALALTLTLTLTLALTLTLTLTLTKVLRLARLPGRGAGG